MDQNNTLEQRIAAIEKRNSRVESDKAWETSMIRRIAVALLTYAVVVLFFYSASLPNPFVNSIVPTMGFLLSTLSLSALRNWWNTSKK